jgi:class 3 adenylate cyclase
VKRLIREGNTATLGGTVRPMSVMFVDLAGFTGMSERPGDRVIPLLSRYFDLVSTAVQTYGGTIDKFIGDAVMAFWGAPASNADHAIDGCRAALACHHILRESGLADDAGNPIRIRIGINSGDMLVGNIGSEVRLNYTVIGDAVNIARRLEGANKIYGSVIIIGPETRRLAGEFIFVRELDRLTVYGREGGLQIYELLGMADEYAELRDWVGLYESGLASYRGRDFSVAIRRFEEVIIDRGHDLTGSCLLGRLQGAFDTAPKRPPTLRCRAGCIQELRDGCDKLGGREGLLQKDAVGHTARRPSTSTGASHVDDRECGIDLSGLSRDLPAVHSALQANVGHKRSVSNKAALEKGHRLLAGGRNGRLKAALGKGVFNDALHLAVILNDQHHWQFLQTLPQRAPSGPPEDACRATKFP